MVNSGTKYRLLVAADAHIVQAVIRVEIAEVESARTVCLEYALSPENWEASCRSCDKFDPAFAAV